MNKIKKTNMNPLAELNWKYYVPKSCTYRRILVT